MDDDHGQQSPYIPQARMPSQKTVIPKMIKMSLIMFAKLSIITVP